MRTRDLGERIHGKYIDTKSVGFPFFREPRFGAHALGGLHVRNCKSRGYLVTRFSETNWQLVNLLQRVAKENTGQ